MVGRKEAVFVLLYSSTANFHCDPIRDKWLDVSSQMLLTVSIKVQLSDYDGWHERLRTGHRQRSPYSEEGVKIDAFRRLALRVDVQLLYNIMNVYNVGALLLFAIKFGFMSISEGDFF